MLCLCSDSRTSLTSPRITQPPPTTPLAIPPLEETLNVDVCVIGAGLTGISTALNLAERGHSVAVLEASKVGWAASGRNGGQLIGGFACDIDTFAKFMPADDVKRVWDMGIETLDIVKERVAKHQIDCDLTFGYLTAANKPRDTDALQTMARRSATALRLRQLPLCRCGRRRRICAIASAIWAVYSTRRAAICIR